MKQLDRPTQISTILKAIGSDFPAEMRVSLEEYISDLEANQMAVLPSRSASSRDPIKLYWRAVRREQNRRERALRKQNNYQ